MLPIIQSNNGGSSGDNDIVEKEMSQAAYYQRQLVMTRA